MTEIYQQNKIYTDDQNSGYVLDPEKTGNVFIYWATINEMQGKYIIRKLNDYGPVKIYYSDLLPEAFRFFEKYSKYKNEYPGWNNDKLKEWLNEL